MPGVKTLPAFLFEDGKMTLHFCKKEFFSLFMDGDCIQ
jgi:hypothetical protein